MKAKDFFDTDKHFRSKEHILKTITLSEYYDSNLENFISADALLLFSTSRQKTWLVSTKYRLYCILDDIRRPEPVLAWVKDREQLFENKNFKPKLQPKDQSNSVGTINIGPKEQEWYFSKPLFSNNDVVATLTKFVENNMLKEE